MENRPSLQTAEKAAPTIRDLLADPRTTEKFTQIVPRHLSPERMMRVNAQAVFKVPKLAECHPMTLLGAMMACASLGLEPNTTLGHAYLIPFEKKKKTKDGWKVDRVDVNLIIGYRGFIDLARRTGTLISIHADVVYEGDDFSYEYGSNMHVRHVPKGDNLGRAPIFAYAHAKLTDGEAFEVLPYQRVLRIRDGSQAYQQAIAAKAEAERDAKKAFRMKTFAETPWVKHEHEMSAKTMVRRLAKWLPMSIDFANAAALDEMSDNGRPNFESLAASQAKGGLDLGLAFAPGPGEEIEDIEVGQDDPDAVGREEREFSTAAETATREEQAAREDKGVYVVDRLSEEAVKRGEEENERILGRRNDSENRAKAGGGVDVSSDLFPGMEG